jgi:hypothetical protein
LGQQSVRKSCDLFGFLSSSAFIGVHRRLMTIG